MITQMDCYGMTDTGRKRPTNQDHYLIADLNKSMRVHGTSLQLEDETRIYGGSQGKLLLVADGMGGHAEGERACAIAVDQLTAYVLNSLGWCFRLEEDSERDFAEDLKHALESCEKSIQAVADSHPEMSSMGTTMTMVYIVWPRAFVVHVGDSRCYLLRNGHLDQITVDHTMSEIMSKAGRMSREEARHSPMGHVLVNVLGGRSHDLFVDVNKLTLEQDDMVLLCTDGLYDMIADETLKEQLTSGGSAEKTCRNLVELANDSGGKDNITVIVSRFLSPKADKPQAVLEGEVSLEQLTVSGT
jgi:protein phosphatase